METGFSTQGARNSAYNSTDALMRSTRHIDVTFLQQLCPDNPEFCQHMLAAFQSESLRYMESVRTQLSESDLAAIAKTAHAMKPMGSYIGATTLTALMAQLETSANGRDLATVVNIHSQVEILLTDINSEIGQYLKCA